MLARKSLLLFTVNMIGSALGFLSTIVIARWMGAAALGTVSYLLGLLGMLSVLLDMGFHVAHLKRVSEADEDSAPLIGTFLVIRVALIALFLVAVALLPLVRSYLGRPLFESRAERSVYYAIAAFYVLHALSSVFLHTFEANQQTAKQSLASFAGSLASFLAKVAVAVLGFGVAALGVAYLVEPAVLVAAGIFLFGGYRVARPTRQHLAGYVTYALPLVLNTAVSMITANVNPVLIRAYWTAAQVGYYSSVMGFQIVLERVGLAVMVLFFPQASSDAARGNWDEIRRRLFVIERYLLTILVFLGVVLIAFSKEIVAIALGSEFMPAVPVLICLVISSILAAFFQPYRTVLYAIEKQNYLVLSSVLGLLVLLAADIVLVPRRIWAVSLLGLGGVGAALALTAMTLVEGVVQARAVRKYAGIGIYWQALWYALAGVVVYGFLAAGNQVVSTTIWVRFPLLVSVGLGVYLAVLALCHQFTRADLQVFLNVLHPPKMIEYVATELTRR